MIRERICKLILNVVRQAYIHTSNIKPYLSIIFLHWSKFKSTIATRWIHTKIFAPLDKSTLRVFPLEDILPLRFFTNWWIHTKIFSLENMSSLRFFSLEDVSSSRFFLGEITLQIPRVLPNSQRFIRLILLSLSHVCGVATIVHPHMYRVYLENIGKQGILVFYQWKMEWELPPSILVWGLVSNICNWTLNWAINVQFLQFDPWFGQWTSIFMQLSPWFDQINSQKL
jgi:hypothetical protein